MQPNEIYETMKFNEKESSLFIPNEIFEDLIKNIKTTSHIAFSYSYIYLITWLYRYAKHFNVNDIIDNKKIKTILGYNSNNQTLDYLIKKNGLLDDMGYTESTRDYPLTWDFNKYNREDISFFMSSEIEGEVSDHRKAIPKRFFLKKPLKGFYRIRIEDREEFEEVGTFYDISNTHCIPFEVFVYCMSNPKISCVGFYLYCYLKHKNDIFEFGYDVSLDELSIQTGIARRTLNSYLGVLKSYTMIDFHYNQDFFAAGMKKEDRKANTYSARGYALFSETPEPFKRIKYISNIEYVEKQNKKEDSTAMSKYVEDNVPF